MLKNLNNLQIKERLTKAFIMVACILAAASIVALIFLIIISETYSNSLVNYGFAQGNVGRAMSQFADSRSAMRGIIGYDRQDAIDTLLENHQTYKDQFTKEFDSMQEYMVTQENKKLYADLSKKLSEYWVLEAEIVTQGSTTDSAQSAEAQDKALSQLAPMYNEIYDGLTDIMDVKVDRGQSMSKILTIAAIVLAVVMVVVIIGSFAFALSLGRRIANSIAIPLNKMKERLEIFAKGDFSSPFPTVDTKDEVSEMIGVTVDMAANLQFIISDVDHILSEMADANFTVKSKDLSRYEGEFESVLSSMKMLRDQMTATLRSVGESSSQVAAGASNLSDASQNLAEGATDQAGAIEEMQATITTISDDIKATADNAGNSYNQARTYAEEAERSHQEMKAMTEAMTRISDASQQVGNIISEIEDIASQTNLLSLNASIEAARAGEAGRGFSVVADQIRQLAEQSAKSAAETRTLIETSLNAIADGNKTMDVVNASIDRVVEGIELIAQSSKSIKIGRAHV